MCHRFALVAVALLAAMAHAADEVKLPTPEEARASLGGAAKFLLENQNADGSWGSPGNPNVGIDDFWSNPETHRSWVIATTALGCMTLQKIGISEQTGTAYDRGVDYLVANALVKRPSEWDTDNVWAYVYGLQGVVDAYTNPRYATDKRRDALRTVAIGLIEKLKEYQTPSGGWGYYDFEVYAKPGAWATSFTTAVGLIALISARDAGIEVEPKMIDAATKSVQRCRLPNGAFQYSVDPIPRIRAEGINQIKGSLSRIMACNYALRRAGVDVPLDEMRRGVESFFRDHKFLDIARKKPIPHEAYYQNSGYFYFFGHYYAAELIMLLPLEDRQRFWPQLQHEIVKTQEKDGSMWDYPMNSYAKPYGTAYSSMALFISLQDAPLESRKAADLKAGENKP